MSMLPCLRLLDPCTQDDAEKPTRVWKPIGHGRIYESIVDNCLVSFDYAISADGIREGVIEGNRTVAMVSRIDRVGGHGILGSPSRLSRGKV